MFKQTVSIMVLGLFVTGMVYTGLCFNCMISHDSVSQEEYARMAQEIVDQSLEPGNNEYGYF